MGNDPETILFGATPVRTITMNGVTKFVARDISSILGYSRSDKMLNAYVRTNPEYIRFRTSGGTQSARVVTREDIDQVLCHCRHHNASRLCTWLQRHTERTPKGFIVVGVLFELEG